MFAKLFLVAAALAPVALAQTTEPYNFECGGGQYGYGWNNGGDNGNNDMGFAEILASFADISNTCQNGSTVARGTTNNNVPATANDLFNHIQDVVCQIRALTTTLGDVRETDNEQHEVCHAKSNNDLTHDNFLMNMEGQLPLLKGSFVNNGLPSITSCVEGWHQAFTALSNKVNEVAPICTPQQQSSTGIVSNTFQSCANSFRN